MTQTPTDAEAAAEAEEYIDNVYQWNGTALEGRALDEYNAHLAGQRVGEKRMIEWCEKNAWKDTEQEPPQLWLHDIKREFGE